MIRNIIFLVIISINNNDNYINSSIKEIYSWHQRNIYPDSQVCRKRFWAEYVVNIWQKSNKFHTG